MIDDNRKSYAEKMKKYYSKLDKQDSKIDNLTEMIINIVDKNQNLNNLSDNIYSPKYQGPTTVVPNNNKSPTLEGGYSTKYGYMRTLDYEISSPKFYELLINKEHKSDTDVDIKNF